MAQPSAKIIDHNELQLVSSQSGLMGQPSGSSSILFTPIPAAVKHWLATMPLLRRSLSSYSQVSPRVLRTATGERPQSLDGSGDQNIAVESHLPSFVSGNQQYRSAIGDAEMCWKYANQGLTLLQDAVLEARGSNNNRQAFARQLYMHALVYLLQGVPADLTEAEVASLRPAIGPLLQGNNRNHSEVLARPSDPPNPPSLLRRLLASTIVYMFIFFSLILPYVKVAVHSAYRYERTNHISERLFAASLDTMDQVGRKGFGVVGLLLQSGNGKVGASVAGTVAWWIDGISGGIHDGVGEGMALMGILDMKTGPLSGR